METNKEIPTAEDILRSKLLAYTTPGLFEQTIEVMIEFTQLHLSKQAEVITEKVKVKKGDFYSGANERFNDVIVDKQSILQASEEYINNLK